MRTLLAAVGSTRAILACFAALGAALVLAAETLSTLWFRRLG